MNELNFKEELEQKIMKLSQNIWESKVNQASLKSWLENFGKSSLPETCEQTHALYLLSNFTYFGTREIREMLKSAHRDKVKNPLIQLIRKRLGDTKDENKILAELKAEMEQTRFLGIGNPSESGTHLLYFFRQENNLIKDLFVHSHQLFDIKRTIKGTETKISISLGLPEVKRYIFLDDVCGSGDQVISYMSGKGSLSQLKDIYPELEFVYITLVASEKGLKAVKESGIFDRVETIFELDSSYQCFSKESRYFPRGMSLPVSKNFAETMSAKYGKQLGFSEQNMHGYKNGQFLMGFSHNVPDNTLPIIWGENNWTPIFRRYSKLY